MFRYLAAKKFYRLRKFENLKVAARSIFISLLMGIFWSSMPFLGWSEYNLEGLMISCSVEWNKKTVSVISYNISIMIFVYIIPLFTFIYTNSRIIYFVTMFTRRLF
jgi:hypothetical protein